jgi:Xaa-Pro aminopeptidase
VTEAALVIGAEKPLNAFETLTLAPIDSRLVEPALLGADEIAWFNAYHARVRDTLAPSLDAATRAWLITATAPLARA